jgi:hypothetical protein
MCQLADAEKDFSPIVSGFVTEGMTITTRESYEVALSVRSREDEASGHENDDLGAYTDRHCVLARLTAGANAR